MYFQLKFLSQNILFKNNYRSKNFGRKIIVTLYPFIMDHSVSCSYWSPYMLWLWVTLSSVIMDYEALCIIWQWTTLYSLTMDQNLVWEWGAPSSTLFAPSLCAKLWGTWGQKLPLKDTAEFWPRRLKHLNCLQTPWSRLCRDIKGR